MDNVLSVLKDRWSARKIVNLRKVFLLVLPLTLAGLALNGQTMNNEIIRVSQQAKQLIANKQFIEARPLLLQMREYMQQQGTTEELPRIDFYIALGYVFEYYNNQNDATLSEAGNRFQSYLNQYPDSILAPVAKFNLADILAVQGKLEDALRYYIELYDKRPTGIDRNGLLKKITRIYVAKKAWVAGAPYFSKSMQRAETAEERTSAAAYYVIGLAKSGNLEEAGSLLEFFKTSSPVFYSPRFNAALMEIGDQLYESRQYNTAALFYQFVRSYETLHEGLSNYASRLEKEAASLRGKPSLLEDLAEVEAALENTRRELEALKSTTNYTPLLSWRLARVYMEMNRNWEAFWRFRFLVDRYPNHPSGESILYSAFALAIKLEAIDQGEELAHIYLDRDGYRKYRGMIASELAKIYKQKKKWDKLYELTPNYLATDSTDLAAQQIVFTHGMQRLEFLEFDELIREFSQFRSKYPNEVIADELEYMMGLAHLLRQEYDAALQSFDFVISRSDSPYAIDASYRKALALMGKDMILEAEALLKEFVRQHPDNPLRAEVEIALGDIANMNGRPDWALEHFETAKEFTDNIDLLAKATVKTSDALSRLNETQASLTELVDFIDAHPDAIASIPVYLKLAQTHQNNGAPVKALSTMRTTVNKFIDRVGAASVDKLLVTFLKTDASLRTMQSATENFLDEVSENPELLNELIQDRAKQYRYFNEHTNLHPLIQLSFVRDDDFRTQTLENPEHLQTLSAKIRQRFAELSGTPAIDWCREQVRSNSPDASLPVRVRIECALAQLSEPVKTAQDRHVRLHENPELWETLSPASKLWILQRISQDQPEYAAGKLQELLREYVGSAVELDIHLAMADVFTRMGRYREAIKAHEAVLQRFAEQKVAASSMMEIGRLYLELDDYKSARKTLEGILSRTEWRGEIHANALLMLGDSYADQSLYAEAHGFYERLILGYPFFHEVVALAFYKDIKTLVAMGETESARSVLKAYTETPDLQDTRGSKLIEEEIQL
ncbi:tetratricopeptide repeat protein [Coraliomargarita parva]|uniref:tetratricopeptide repeat protein n=1 Tax=Coraliomargarita parva TaxID=3014050 RepID=UPI0022B4DAA7|nr:tetratricopeptide repeat protein [Coraliomargarita parva]